MLIFVKPLAKGHSCCESLDPVPSTLEPAEGSEPESNSLWQLPPRSLLWIYGRCPDKHSALQDVQRKVTAHYLSHKHFQKCSCWLQTFQGQSGSSAAAAFAQHRAQVLPGMSQLLQVGAGALCCVREPVVLESLTQWSSSAQQQPRPCPTPVVPLELEAGAAISNLEEDKMKAQPSLSRAGNEGRREEGAMLKVWDKKRGGRSW